MRRICFVTCRTWPEISASDRLARQALEARGAAAARFAGALLRRL
ncbi:MAG TPA: hypothetical protein VNC82_06755 [Candidatus Limnocylindria bacterium]|nr:hypothetical protein [Candidatus Limnocylindria bacterium]